MSLTAKQLGKALVRQQDQTDCGIACLLSIIKFYKGDNNLENLRRISGTNVSGTTLLGLYQAATQLGFTAEGCEADMEALAVHPDPVVLHVCIDNKLQHYIVCGGCINEDGEQKFIISDPAKGIYYLTSEELDRIWVSKTCLTLRPNEHFVKAGKIKEEKKIWIAGLIKKDYPILLIAAAIGIAITVLGLVMAIFSQKLIDEILPKKELSKLLLSLLLVLLLLFVREGLTVLRQYFLLRQAKDFNVRIIDFFYSKLLFLPKPFFDSRRIGDLTARLNDTSRIQRVISQLAGNVAIDILVTVVTISFLFTYSWKLAAACIIILPCYYLLIRQYNKPVILQQRAIMNSYAKSESNYISTLYGIESIKNSNKQHVFSVANNSVYANYQENVFNLGKLQIRLSFTANSFGILFLIAVLSFVSYSVLNGSHTTGELMAILSLCSSLLPSVANLALISIPLNEAKIAFDRMFEFTGIKPENEIAENAVHSFNKLSAQHLSFRFPGRSQLLKDVSFEVQKGEIIAIMGENGCGKSTITQILQQSYAKENGQIIVNGNQNIDSISLSSWRDMIGIVPQSIHIFNGTVLENIAFDDAVLKPQEAMKFIEEYGFSFFVENLPQFYVTLLGEEGINLSGGQKQMIALMRALYRKPQLLILDEATSAMDRESEQFVFNLLKRIKNNLAVIMITHRLHSLRNICDRIYILESGNITAEGNHETMLQSDNLYSRYWKDLV